MDEISDKRISNLLIGVRLLYFGTTSEAVLEAQLDELSLVLEAGRHFPLDISRAKPSDNVQFLRAWIDEEFSPARDLVKSYSEECLFALLALYEVAGGRYDVAIKASHEAELIPGRRALLAKAWKSFEHSNNARESATGRRAIAKKNQDDIVSKARKLLDRGTNRRALAGILAKTTGRTADYIRRILRKADFN